MILISNGSKVAQGAFDAIGCQYHYNLDTKSLVTGDSTAPIVIAGVAVGTAEDVVFQVVERLFTDVPEREEPQQERADVAPAPRRAPMTGYVSWGGNRMT